MQHTKQMYISKMYFILSYITTDRHVSVASPTIVRVGYKKTNNTKISAQNV